MGVFLFLGATGVGKTELARAIADIAFGTKPGSKDSHLILINCGALKEGRDIVQLLGAPQGLKGYKEGALTNGLRDKGNRCVILFDEVEKAHPEVWQSLLQLFDEGVVIEADGTQYDATGCVLVATSNLGYKEAIAKFNLFERPASELRQLQPKVEDFIWKQVVEYFSPEFRGRFGRENVIFFNHFTREAYLSMMQSQGAALKEEMAKRDIRIEIDPAVYEALAKLAWGKRTEGARPVRRLITTHIRDRIVEARVEDPEQHDIAIGVSDELKTLAEAADSPQAGEADIEKYLNARVINQAHAVKALGSFGQTDACGDERDRPITGIVPFPGALRRGENGTGESNCRGGVRAEARCDRPEPDSYRLRKSAGCARHRAITRCGAGLCRLQGRRADQRPARQGAAAA